MLCAAARSQSRVGTRQGIWGSRSTAGTHWQAGVAMNSKQSYLDLLNAGQRRAYDLLEDLTRSLANLEQRLERNDAVRDEPLGFRRDADDQMQMPAPRATPDRPYQSLARETERLGSRDEQGNTGKFSAELKNLRQELRHQMNAGVRHEFESLRKEMTLAQSSPEPAQSASTPDEAEDFDRRWRDFEDRVAAGSPGQGDSAGLAALHARLEQIEQAVHNLPVCLALPALKEKVRVLAVAIEHFVRLQDRQGPDALLQIEERLDEISRAIVASAVSAQPLDPQPFERIEARIVSLARQLEELLDARPGVEIFDRAVERLAEQVAAIAEKLEGAPSTQIADQVLQGIGQRFDMMSDVLDRRQGDAIEQARALFRDLESRLDEVARRFDQSGGADMLQAIDQRFDDLSRQLEARVAGSAHDDAFLGLETRLASISERLDSSVSQTASIDPASIRSLEAQMAGLSAHLARPTLAMPEFEDMRPRLDEIERAVAGSRNTILTVARQAADDAVRSFAGSNPDAAAVAGLADDLKALELLTRRSDERNSRTFEAIHDTLLKIVVRLGSLEIGAGRAEEQRKPESDNAPSIEPDDARAPVRETPDAEAGPQRGCVELDPEKLTGPSDKKVPERDDDAVIGHVAPDRSAARTPAEAAAAAAVAALGADHSAETEPGARVRSMLGGLVRAFGSRRDNEGPLPSVSAPIAEDLQAQEPGIYEPFDPKIANRPLEPGSGAPDLSAIMKRVRDEQGQPSKAGETDAARADFIAAARRAAQAAAAEAELLNRGSDSKGSTSRLNLGPLFRSKRRTMLLSATAIMLALTGIQLGKTFMTDDEEVARQSASSDGPKDAAAGTPVRDTAQQAQPEDAAAVPAEMPAQEKAVDTGSQAASIEAAVAKPPVMPEVKTAPTSGVAPASVVASGTPRTGAPAHQTGNQAAAAIPDAAARPSAPAPVGGATNSPLSSLPAEAGPAPLREAADAGDAKAMFEIASRFADGRGVKADMKKAAGWYEKSAELGFAPAQYRTGNFYEKGLGVARDVAKAKTWYQRAATQGNAVAMHNLAVLLAMGAGGAPDNTMATHWFLQAAELGVTDSQYNLGILAAKGIGVPQNLEESYKWFALAAKAGDSDGALKRDEIAKALRPEQLERARAALDLWKQKTVNAEANSVEIPETWQQSDDTTASIDMKKVVENLQRTLIRKGYDAGGADGVMGARTKAAIAAFQGDNGLAATGEVDEKLVRALYQRK